MERQRSLRENFGLDEGSRRELSSARGATAAAVADRTAQGWRGCEQLPVGDRKRSAAGCRGGFCFLLKFSV